MNRKNKVNNQTERKPIQQISLLYNVYNSSNQKYLKNLIKSFHFSIKKSNNDKKMSCEMSNFNKEDVPEGNYQPKNLIQTFK